MLHLDLYHALNGGGTDCFSERLFWVITKADVHNLECLRVVFPEHVDLWEKYTHLGMCWLVTVLESYRGK